jgi:asparagine synthase (glutamine-hydrolysing)
MCGIAGIVSPAHRDAIGAMTLAMVHRGPDGYGYYSDEHMALGQRRLSIIDLDGGKQPIANETGTLQLVCNGEIYNSPELRERLIRAGHSFKTKTDVEVILHLYEDHGRDCVTHLRGMFAFAIWDSVKRTLFLARDHLGQKPLFFYCHGRDFLFASEIKALFASGLVQPDIDLEGLWHYISLRYIPDQYSLFRGVRKLPAATSLLWNDGRIELKRYWRPDFRPKLTGSEEQIADELEAVLLDTVKLHLLSDVRVGTFLSGGIDSSTVAAMMARVSGEPVPSFSIGVREQQFDELPYARMVSQRYGMEAHEQVVEADLIHLIPSMIYHMDEPADPFGVGIYLVSQVASEFVKVVLCGDGGDENFAGYDRFAGQRLVDYYCLLPTWLRRHVIKRLVGLIPESFGYKSLAQKAAWVNEMSFFTRGERYAHSMSFLRFMPQAKERLFTNSARQRVQDDDSVAKVLQHFEADNVEDLLDRMLYTDLMTRMPDHLLAVVDRMSMAHSLETRPPLIDYKVVEYAASIPGSMKLRGRNLKYMLKKVAARYLPKELIEREKQGFAFPIAIWLRTDLRAFVRNLFAESRFVAHGIFEKTYMEQLVTEHLQGRMDNNFRLWILINLELWYRLYFEGETTDSLREFTDRLMVA